MLYVPTERFIEDDILTKGFNFDGSSIGYSEVEKSDMICIPDSSSFLLLPHEENEARFICEIYNTDLHRSRLDSRSALKNVLESISHLGFNEVRIGPEMEFFLIRIYPSLQLVLPILLFL